MNNIEAGRDTNKTSIALPTHDDVALSTNTQYGIRWADGSIDWTTTASSTGHVVYIHDLLPDHEIGSIKRVAPRYSKQYWESTLKSKAGAARMPLDEFMDTYSFVKRTVTLSVAAAETVQA